MKKTLLLLFTLFYSSSIFAIENIDYLAINKNQLKQALQEKVDSLTEKDLESWLKEINFPYTLKTPSEIEQFCQTQQDACVYSVNDKHNDPTETHNLPESSLPIESDKSQTQQTSNLQSTEASTQNPQSASVPSDAASTIVNTEVVQADNSFPTLIDKIYEMILFIVLVLLLYVFYELFKILRKDNKQQDLKKKESSSVLQEKATKIPLVSEPAVTKAISVPIETQKWRIFHESLQGRDHLKASPAIPCQDNHYIEPIDDNWGVAVVCDGAGSHKYSHFGSKFVSEFSAKHLAEVIKNSQLYQKGIIPSENAWRDVCKTTVFMARQALEKYIDQQKVNYPDMTIRNAGCTLIIAVYSPVGLFVGHIGDGRAGYYDGNSWQSMIKPFKGEYANQTIFINSDHIYADMENSKDPTNPYLETRIIQADIKAFVLMSDGCEKGMYHIDEYDEKNGKIREINRPINGFSTLAEELMSRNKDAATDYFHQVLMEGNEPLKEEGDDKTLILAICKG